MTCFDLSGRRAVVVGGTTGIGRAISLGLAEAGARVLACGRRTDPELAVQLGTDALSVDATSSESVQALRKHLEAESPTLDILVNCAGRTFRKPTAEVNPDDWNSLLDTNVTGMLRTCQALYPLLKASGRGRIINIASLSSFVAFHEVAAYGASKAAVIALTQTLGCEWAKDGIRTNAIVPGVFETDLNRELLNGTPRGQELRTRTPLGRFGDVSEIAPTAVFLASDAVSFITGTSIAIDGGFLASGVNQ